MKLRVGGVCSMVTSFIVVVDAGTDFGFPDGASSILLFTEALLGEVIGVSWLGIVTLLDQISSTTNVFCFVASSRFGINFPVSKSVVGRA